jgi:hypothetical protein
MTEQIPKVMLAVCHLHKINNLQSDAKNVQAANLGVYLAVYMLRSCFHCLKCDLNLWSINSYAYRRTDGRTDGQTDRGIRISPSTMC